MLATPTPETITLIKAHLAEFTGWFNDAAANANLNVALDPSLFLSHIDVATNLGLSEIDHAFRLGRVTAIEVETAIAAISKKLSQPGRSALLVESASANRALGTTLLTMFAAPIQFLRSEKKYAPLLLTADYNERERAQLAMRQFLLLYGSIGIHRTGEQISEALPTVPEQFCLSDHMYDLLGEDQYPGGLSVTDQITLPATAVRTAGNMMEVIAPHRERALERGREPMIMLDNSLMSPRANSDRTGSRRPSLVSRKLDEINNEIRLDDIAEMTFGFAPSRQARPTAA